MQLVGSFDYHSFICLVNPVYLAHVIIEEQNLIKLTYLDSCILRKGVSPIITAF
jgi:hypothetical protein